MCFLRAAFQRQQPLFARHAAAITGEAAIAANHAMTGHDHRNLVGAVGRRDGTCGSGFANLARLLAIAARLAVGNRKQRPPDGLLKGRAYQVQRDVKLAAFASEMSR